MSLDEDKRVSIVKRILQQTQSNNPQKTSELNSLLSGETVAPIVTIPADVWNAERLNGYLEDIDASITSGEHKRAITLSYTCLEGFFKAFIKYNLPDKTHITDIIAMSKEIQTYLKTIIPTYPDEALKLLNHISHTIDKTRNSFSESHFGGEAEKWLSTFIRDCTNSTIRLLLSFM